MPLRGQEVQRMKVGTLRTHSGILLLLFLSCGYFLTICPSAFEMQRSHALKKRKRKISALPSCIDWDTHASYIWMFVEGEREKRKSRVTKVPLCVDSFVQLPSFSRLNLLTGTSIYNVALSHPISWPMWKIHSFIIHFTSWKLLFHTVFVCQGSYSWHSTQAQLKSQFEAFWKFSFKNTTTFKQIRSIKKKHKKVKNQHIKVEVLCLMSLSSSRRRRGSD